jgi:hypothetical protein
MPGVGLGPTRSWRARVKRSGERVERLRFVASDRSALQGFADLKSPREVTPGEGSISSPGSEFSSLARATRGHLHFEASADGQEPPGGSLGGRFGLVQIPPAPEARHHGVAKLLIAPALDRDAGVHGRPQTSRV